MHDDSPFWKQKTLEQMTSEEWESLCDGCGRCCLIKLEDEDTGEIVHTRAACKLLNLHSCRCMDYAGRFGKVPDCVSLTPEGARDLNWLPETCAYRLVARGEDLAWWHPLVSGDADTVHQAGVSVRGIAVSEKRVKGKYERYLLRW
jgi:uncharacterized cysteine cluster protein YcgN (CxxCxxCC family)